MTILRKSTDQAVCDAVEEVAKLACDRLGELFPGCDAGGITSNFQGTLVELLGTMLKGRSPIAGRLIQLPALVIDDAFFGNPLIRGESFLIIKRGVMPGEADMSADATLQVLEPESSRFRPIDRVGDAFTLFEYAAAAAARFLVDEGLSIEQARALRLSVEPVVPVANRETGWLLLADQRKAA